MSSLAVLLIFITVLFSGAMAGLFYAYSISVMWGLDAISGQDAVAAMQSINQQIQNPIFFTTFFLTPLVAVAAAIACTMAGQTSAAVAVAAAGIIYVFGAFVPTVAINVPMNEALAILGTGREEDWLAYSPRWTFWNHLRTLACFASLASSAAALFLWERTPSTIGG